MTRGLLIVAAEFPPVKGIGRLRPLKFCQHLDGFGWTTAVLAPAEGDIQPVDRTTLDEIPSFTRVYRASIPRPKDALARSVKALLGRASAGQEMALAPTSDVTTARKSATSQVPDGKDTKASMLARFDAFVRKNVLIPDDIALWYWPAIRAGMRAIRDSRPHAILATAPHFTNLLIGAGLARRSGIPWIADYRDLWTGDVLRAWVPPWRQRLELAMERRVLASAAAVTTVSEPKSEVLRGRLPPSHRCPVVTLTNGYDPEEFEGVAPEKGPPGPFRIVYAGRLFKNRRGYELIEAAGQLLKDNPELSGRLRIEYYGGVSPEIAARMSALLAQYALEDIVAFHPDVPYDRSKALQMGADALLLIVDSGETSSGVIPGKLFEYIAARRPILCIAAPGATTEIIAKGRLGEVVAPGDVASLKSALQRMLVGARSPFLPDDGYLEQFSRRNTVVRLAALLDEVAGPGRQ